MRVAGKPLPISVMQATRGRRRDMVLYWARFGDTHPQTLWEQRIQIAKHALVREKHDGFLVRLSVTERDGRAELDGLKAFVNDLRNEIPRQLSEQLF